MEQSRCNADAKHIRHFLDICDGNWHSCIYVRCVSCKTPGYCNGPHFLYHPDENGSPCVLPMADARMLFSRIKEHKTPTVINNRQEYGLTEEEFFLWSSLAFQIRQIHELQSAFSERLKNHHHLENIPMEPYLNRLLLRGLIVKGDGLTGVDALYRLLGELYISPLQDSFSVRLFTCIYLCMKKKLHTKELGHYLKKPARTAIEDTVLQIAKKVQISTAELVTCVEQGVHPQNTEQLLTQLYETSDATFRTLAQDIQFTHAGYPVLEAISNLYLNKQIAFEKL